MTNSKKNKFVFHNDVEWGNRPINDISDEKLLNINWNYVMLNNERYADPEYKQKHHNSVKKFHKSKTSEFIEKHKQSIRKFTQDTTYQQKQRQMMLAKQKDPEYKRKQLEGMHKVFKTEEHKRKLQKLKTKLHGIKCQVKQPGKLWKTFDSFGDANRYYNWPLLQNNPIKCFPKDGSINTTQLGRFKGYQTKRIID